MDGSIRPRNIECIALTETTLTQFGHDVILSKLKVKKSKRSKRKKQGK